MFTVQKEAMKSFAYLLPFFDVEDKDVDQFVSFMDSHSSDNFIRSFLRNRKYWADEFKRYRLERRYDNKVFGGEQMGSGATDSFNDSVEGLDHLNRFADLRT